MDRLTLLPHPATAGMNEECFVFVLSVMILVLEWINLVSSVVKVQLKQHGLRYEKIILLHFGFIRLAS